MTGGVVGTVAYMAPEQARGDAGRARRRRLLGLPGALRGPDRVEPRLRAVARRRPPAGPPRARCRPSPARGPTCPPRLCRAIDAGLRRDPAGPARRRRARRRPERRSAAGSRAARAPRRAGRCPPLASAAGGAGARGRGPRTAGARPAESGAAHRLEPAAARPRRSAASALAFAWRPRGAAAGGIVAGARCSWAWCAPAPAIVLGAIALVDARHRLALRAAHAAPGRRPAALRRSASGPLLPGARRAWCRAGRTACGSRRPASSRRSPGRSPPAADSPAGRRRLHRRPAVDDLDGERSPLGRGASASGSRSPTTPRPALQALAMVVGGHVRAPGAARPRRPAARDRGDPLGGARRRGRWSRRPRPTARPPSAPSCPPALVVVAWAAPALAEPPAPRPREGVRYPARSDRMSLLRNIEQKIEGLFERGFRRAFRSSLQPVELARKLGARDGGPQDDLGLPRLRAQRVHGLPGAPRTARASPRTSSRWSPSWPPTSTPTRAATGLSLVAPATVTLATDEDLRAGEFGIACRMADPPEAPRRAEAAADGAGRRRRAARRRRPPRPRPAASAGAAPPGARGRERHPGHLRRRRRATPASRQEVMTLVVGHHAPPPHQARLHPGPQPRLRRRAGRPQRQPRARRGAPHRPRLLPGGHGEHQRHGGQRPAREAPRAGGRRHDRDRDHPDPRGAAMAAGRDRDRPDRRRGRVPGAALRLRLDAWCAAPAASCVAQRAAAARRRPSRRRAEPRRPPPPAPAPPAPAVPAAVAGAAPPPVETAPRRRRRPPPRPAEVPPPGADDERARPRAQPRPAPVVESSPDLEEGRVIPLEGGITIGRSDGGRPVDRRRSSSPTCTRASCAAAPYHFVEDLGSTNGTFLNDRRVEQRRSAQGARRAEDRPDDPPLRGVETGHGGDAGRPARAGRAGPPLRHGPRPPPQRGPLPGDGRPCSPWPTAWAARKAGEVAAQVAVDAVAAALRAGRPPTTCARAIEERQPGDPAHGRARTPTRAGWAPR